MKKIIAFVILCPLMFGCSSWLKRQSCENVNWYQYGHDVAMAGRRLTGDVQVKSCADAEFNVPYRQLDAGFKAGMEKYCQPKVVYATGKNGEFFNPELCDPGQVRILKQEYDKGLKAYCTPGSGFTAGSSGRVYHNVCSEADEPAFMKEYRRGRRSYLSGKIIEAETSLIGVERALLDLERERNNVGWRLNALPPAPKDPNSVKDSSEFERNRLKRDLDSADDNIRRKLSEKEKLFKEKAAYQAELASLQD